MKILIFYLNHTLAYQEYRKKNSLINFKLFFVSVRQLVKNTPCFQQSLSVKQLPLSIHQCVAFLTLQNASRVRVRKRAT